MTINNNGSFIIYDGSAAIQVDESVAGEDWKNAMPVLELRYKKLSNGKFCAIVNFSPAAEFMTPQEKAIISFTLSSYIRWLGQVSGAKGTIQ